jgi:hypothetical protein
MKKRNKHLAGAGLSFMLVAFAMLSAPADAKSRKHGQAQPPAAHQQQVACTVLGCQTIPAACYPKEEHSPTGIPTGFDQIVCPPGVWPF